MELGVLERTVRRALRANTSDPLVTVAAASGLSQELAAAVSTRLSKEPLEERRNKLRASAEQWA